MQDILREIFDGIYAEKIGSHPLTNKESAVWERAISVLGGDAVDEMLSAQCRSLVETQYDFFREGFRLGALLMLGLSQAT